MGKGTNSSLDNFSELTFFDFLLTILYPIFVLSIYLFFYDFKGAFIGEGCLSKKFVLQEIHLYTYIFFRVCLQDRDIYKVIFK